MYYLYKILGKYFYITISIKSIYYENEFDMVLHYSGAVFNLEFILLICD